MTNELAMLGLFLEEYAKAKEEMNGVDNVKSVIFITDKTSIHVFEGDELVGIYTKETGLPDFHILKFSTDELLDPKLLMREKDGADRDGDIVMEPKDYSHKPNGNEARFKKITKEMLELYSRKNTDYGGSFDESLDEDGLLVAKIRLKDKLNRFSKLINNDSLVKDESIRDTLIDLANYSIMTLMWLDDEKH